MVVKRTSCVHTTQFPRTLTAFLTTLFVYLCNVSHFHLRALQSRRRGIHRKKKKKTEFFVLLGTCHISLCQVRPGRVKQKAESSLYARAKFQSRLFVPYDDLAAAVGDIFSFVLIRLVCGPENKSEHEPSAAATVYYNSGKDKKKRNRFSSHLPHPRRVALPCFLRFLFPSFFGGGGMETIPPCFNFNLGSLDNLLCDR